MGEQTSRMHLIGYWISDLRDEEFCAPQEVVGKLDPGVRARLADYLDVGSEDWANSQLGYSWCRFFCGISDQAMGSRALTDGAWSWPEGLSHYVRAHGVVLPEEFMAHALGHPAAPPVHTAESPRQVGAGSVLDFWRAWCAQHRSPVIQERLRRARVAADARARDEERRAIQRLVAEVVARQGLGEGRCIYAGCGERVLTGMRICARHSLQECEYCADACYQITREHLE